MVSGKLVAGAFASAAVSLCQAAAVESAPRNSTFQNPMLPGWHSDGSCVFVPELDDTTFCTASTFLNFPGLPVYASRDLVNWKLVSNAFSRTEQLPRHASMSNNNRGGIWAPTIRYNDGKMYIVVTYVHYDPKERVDNYIFQAADPYKDGSWEIPFKITNPTGGNHIDPDLFWDDDGTAYMASGWGKIFLSTVDTTNGVASERVEVWKGSGDRNPEGPHIYKKDDYYYMIVAEGGAALGHSATIGRAKDIFGPYEGYENNPVLTNRETDLFYQSVGHADLFQDANGNWWATALATRSGPELVRYPMGREAILTPVTWKEGEWPVFGTVHGVMEGLLPKVKKVDPAPSNGGYFVGAADKFDFKRGFSFPSHVVHFRSKTPDTYRVEPSLLWSRLRLTPSKLNLTGSDDLPNDVENGVTFAARKQTATLFDFSVDLSFKPKADKEEAGITVFLNQQQHIDLSVVRSGSKTQLQLAATAFGRAKATTPETVTKILPKLWSACPIRLNVRADDSDNYKFKASSACGLGSIDFGSVTTDITSGGFLGTLLGVYATTNDGEGQTPSYWSRWRYTPIAQELDINEYALT